jgi:hypothetical protein
MEYWVTSDKSRILASNITYEAHSKEKVYVNYLQSLEELKENAMSHYSHTASSKSLETYSHDVRHA